jgi:regulator of protease activity HflC (stomatin/prohibitin superfamily)
MSINDPQWGNSHRPEQKDPEQVPDQAGTAPVQPDNGLKTAEAAEPSQSESSSGGPKKPGEPPEGPPDLEVLWQQLVHKIRCKLAKLLRREPPPLPDVLNADRPVPTTSSVEEPLSWQALSLKSWLIGVSLLIGAWLMSGFYLVDANQRGVLSRFGVIVSTEDPGWHWRWPYPIESVRLVNVTNDRTLEVGVANAKLSAPLMMLTSDQSLVGLGYAVVYQVNDPILYLSRLDAPAELLGAIAETALRQVVATQPMTLIQGAVAKPGADTANPSFLEAARAQMQAALDQLDTGIKVKALQLKDVVLPSPVLKAAKQAEQDEQAQIQALRNAQLASGESLIKARKLANRLQEETSGYTQELDVAVLRLNASNPKPTSADALSQVASANASLRAQYPLVFDNYAGLVARTQQTGTNQSKRAAAQATDSAAASKTGEWRDRELMRSRDRVDRPGSGS